MVEALSRRKLSMRLKVSDFVYTRHVVCYCWGQIRWGTHRLCGKEPMLHLCTWTGALHVSTIRTDQGQACAFRNKPPYGEGPRDALWGLSCSQLDAEKSSSRIWVDMSHRRTLEWSGPSLVGRKRARSEEIKRMSREIINVIGHLVIDSVIDQHPEVLDLLTGWAFKLCIIVLYS